MSRGLTQVQRTYLDWIESTEEWSQFNHADMIGQVIKLLDRYAFPQISMARFLLELDQRLGRAATDATADVDERGPEESWALEVARVKFELAAMAAILTRKERGKPEIV